MPKKITMDARWVDAIEVPRDGEGIDAGDVELPMGDLLGNDRFLLRLVNNLQTEIEDLKKSRGGFTLSTQPGVTLEPGSTQTLTLLLGRYENFNDAVTLTVDGLPGGVTAALSETSTTGSSVTLTLTASAQAVPGNFTLLVTGTSGSRTAQARTQLTVTAQTLPATFDIIPSRNLVTVSGTAGDKFPIAIDRQGGFADAVAFSGVNLPSGVTLTFTPETTTGNTTEMQVQTNTGFPAGTYNLQIRATSGSKVVTKALSMTVTPPAVPEGDFSLIVGYDMFPDTSNGATITINRTGGFRGDVIIGPIQADAVIQRLGDGTVRTFAPPVLNINGQTGRITTSANTVRVTANGAATGWVNSGVADSVVTMLPFVAGRDVVTAYVQADTIIGTSLVTRRVPVTIRVGTRSS